MVIEKIAPRYILANEHSAGAEVSFLNLQAIQLLEVLGIEKPTEICIQATETFLQYVYEEKKTLNTTKKKEEDQSVSNFE